jgi:Flp pilus assembly protein TadG
MITFKKNKKTKLEKAQTMVEFALVFPLILLITYGIIEFGRMVFVYAAITGSAREGARYGAAAGVGSNGKVQYADCQGIRDSARSTAFLITNPKVDISYDKGPGVPLSYTCDTLNPNNIVLGDRIIVTVSTTYTPWIAFLGLNGFNITSTNARTILVDIKMPTSTPKSYP